MFACEVLRRRISIGGESAAPLTNTVGTCTLRLFKKYELLTHMSFSWFGHSDVVLRPFKVLEQQFVLLMASDHQIAAC